MWLLEFEDFRLTATIGTENVCDDRFDEFPALAALKLTFSPHRIGTGGEFLRVNQSPWSGKTFSVKSAVVFRIVMLEKATSQIVRMPNVGSSIRVEQHVCEI